MKSPLVLLVVVGAVFLALRSMGGQKAAPSSGPFGGWFGNSNQGMAEAVNNVFEKVAPKAQPGTVTSAAISGAGGVFQAMTGNPWKVTNIDGSTRT